MNVMTLRMANFLNLSKSQKTFLKNMNVRNAKVQVLFVTAIKDGIKIHVLLAKEVVIS